MGDCPPSGRVSWARVGDPSAPALREEIRAVSDVEENGLVCALDADVEAIDGQVAALLLVGNERAAPVGRDQRKNGIAVVGCLVRKIKPGIDLAQHSP